MLFFFFLNIFILVPNRNCSSCSVTVENEADICEICKIEYFRIDSDFIGLQPPSPFFTEYCQKRNLKVKYQKKAYVSENDCTLACDGTIERPYQDLYSAISIEHSLSKEFYNIEIEFLLINKNHILRTDFKGEKNKQFFRRSWASLTIRPLSCNEVNITGCFNSSDKDARIVLKSANFSFFVSRSLHLKDLVIDGSDLKAHYRNVSLSPKLQYCSETDLDKLPESICYIKDTNINLAREAGLNYGFIVIETIADCNDCILQGPPSILIESCLFNFINTIQNQDDVVLAGLISISYMSSYNINLQKVSVYKSYFWRGLVYSLSAFDSYQEKLDYASIQSKSVLSADGLSVVNYNYFSFQSTGISSIISVAIWADDIINITSVNISQTIAVNTSFLINIFTVGSSGFVYIKNANIEDTSITDFLTNITSVSKLTLGQISLKRSSGLRVQAFETNVSIDSSMFEAFKIIRYFILISSSRLSITNSTWLSIYPLNVLDSTLILVNTFYPFVPSEFFTTTYSRNLSSDWLYLTGCLFNQLVVPISDNLKVFRELRLTNCSFLNIKIGSSSLFRTYVEGETYLERVIYNGNEMNYFLNLLLVRNTTLNYICFTNSRSQFLNIKCTDLGNRQIIFYIQYSLFQNCNYTNDNGFIVSIQQYMRGFHDLFIINTSFVGLKYESQQPKVNIYVLYFEAIQYTNLTFVNIIDFDGARGILLQQGRDKISGYESEGFVTDSFFINLYNTLLVININLAFTITNSYFTSRLEIHDKAAIQMLSYTGSFSMINSSFINISTYQTVLDITTDWHRIVYINNCKFFNNSADISLFFRRSDIQIFDLDLKIIPSLNFGIHNCMFSNNRSPKYSSIILLISSDILINNCTFSHGRTDAVGAAFSTQEQCSILCLNVVMLNCTTGKDGGCVTLSFQSHLRIYNTLIRKSRAEYGGAIAAKKSIIFIADCLLEDVQALEGGIINSMENTIIIKRSFFGFSMSMLRGGHIFALESDITISESQFSNGYSFEEGGSIYASFSFYFRSEKTIFFSCFTESSGIIFFEGSNTVNHTILDYNCYANQALSGVCLYLNEGRVNIMGGLLQNNTASSIVFLFSGLETVFGTIINCTVSNNSIFGEASVVFSRASFLLNWISFSNNTLCLKCTSSRTISVYSSTVQFTNCSFLHQRQEILAFSIISVENSFVNFAWCHLNGAYELQGISLTTSTLYLNNTEIESCKSEREGGAFWAEDTQVHIRDTRVLNNLAKSASAFYLKDSSVSITNLELMNNTQGRDSDILIETSSSRKKMSVEFVDCIMISYGSNLALRGIENITIINSSFEKINSQANNLSAITVSEAQIVYVHSSTFKNLQGDSGLSVNFYSFINSYNSFSLLNSSFLNCSSNENGGALVVTGNFLASISGNIFYNNFVSKTGGAIFIDCPGSVCSVTVKESLFINNKAKTGSGNIIKIEQKIEIYFENDNKIDNEKNFTSEATENLLEYDLLGFPDEIFVLSTSPEEIIKLKELYNNKNTHSTLLETFLKLNQSTLTLASGQKHQLAVLVVDNFKNMAVVEVKSNINLNQVKDYDKERANTENDRVTTSTAFAVLENFTLIAVKNKSYLFTLSFSNKIVSLSRNITIFLRLCVKGEVHINKQCIPCPPKFFSLEENPTDATECIPCPKNAECPGEHYIIPDKGFYKHTAITTEVVRCAVEESCPSQTESFELFYRLNKNNGESANPIYVPACGIGYEGNICAQCEEAYGLVASKLCVKCSEKATFFIKFAFGLLASILFVIYQAWDALQFKEEDEYQRALLKLFVNHSYYLGYISKFAVDWSNQFLEFIDLNDSYLSTVPAEVVVFDCFLIGKFEKNKIFFIRNLIFSFSPLFIIVAAISLRVFTDFLLNMLSSKKRKTFNFLNFMERSRVWAVSLSVLTLYNLYSRLVMNSFQKLRCIPLDETDARYLQEQPRIQCWVARSEHTLLIFLIFLPNFLLWCVGWPIFLFFILRRRRRVFDSKGMKAPHEYTVGKVFMFLTYDYKPAYYYWECFFYLFNLSISGLLVAVTRLHPITQGALLILLFVIALWITERKKPFSSPLMNNLTVFSYLVTILTICFAVQSSLANIKSGYKTFSFVVVIAMNFLFYLVWSFLLLSSYFKSIKSSLKSLRANLTSKRSRLKFRTSPEK